jgi:hypothetical protein
MSSAVGDHVVQLVDQVSFRFHGVVEEERVWSPCHEGSRRRKQA